MYTEEEKGVFVMTTFLGNPVTFTGPQVRDTDYDSSLTTLNLEKKIFGWFCWQEKSTYRNPIHWHRYLFPSNTSLQPRGPLLHEGHCSFNGFCKFYFSLSQIVCCRRNWKCHHALRLLWPFLRKSLRTLNKWIAFTCTYCLGFRCG